MENLNLLTVLLPDQTQVVIRENNGNDEEIISRASTSKNLTNIPEYLSEIIVEADGEAKKVSKEEIMRWPISKKYYLLLMARIHSIGPELRFNYTYRGEKKPRVIVEDLRNFTLGSENEQAVKPIARELQRGFSLSTGKQVKYTYLNTYGEQFAMEYEKDKISMATLPIRQRGLQCLMDSEWREITRFDIFNSREMSEIRSDINTHDKGFFPSIQIPSPGNPKEIVDELPLFLLDAFFYPEGIL